MALLPELAQGGVSQLEGDLEIRDVLSGDRVSSLGQLHGLQERDVYLDLARIVPVYVAQAARGDEANGLECQPGVFDGQCLQYLAHACPQPPGVCQADGLGQRGQQQDHPQVGVRVHQPLGVLHGLEDGLTYGGEHGVPQARANRHGAGHEVHEAGVPEILAPGHVAGLVGADLQQAGDMNSPRDSV